MKTDTEESYYKYLSYVTNLAHYILSKVCWFVQASARETLRGWHTTRRHFKRARRGLLEMAAQMSMQEVALWATPTREFDYLLNERSEFRK
jgi:hypothetical protein